VKPGVVRGYEIEPAARFDSVALRFEWFDHIQRGAARPALVQDRINYQVMGANRWSHAPSIERMSNAPLTLYLTDTKVDEHYRLAPAHPKEGRLTQTVDFADRKVQNNLYPMRAIEAQVGSGNGFTFISDPFEEAVSFDGQLSGQLTAAINKKDFDFSLALYELMPDGRYFYLSYYVGRASYAADMSKRRLLTPGKLTRIPFDRTPLISRQLSRGSRLVLLLTVNKNAHAQVNYGTGKDVSDESIEDAKEPLQVHWHTDSFVKLPLTRVSAELPGIPRETTRLNLIEPLPDPH
jgi:predicted acyl esterase